MDTLALVFKEAREIEGSSAPVDQRVLLVASLLWPQEKFAPHFFVILRWALVPIFVLLCYVFEWEHWRSLNCWIFVATSNALGVSMCQTGIHSFEWNGSHFEFATSCTMLDAFFGSIPLLWQRDLSVRANMLTLLSYFVCLTGFNFFRLHLSILLHTAGLPWFIAHELLAAISYFAIFLWIVSRLRRTRA